ncbi:hypothetical protein AB6859_23975 [Rahnella inusitata]|uniref:hypothetical protein n=1 Tax=Rahnella inusitata TaxID=58169 RepID=UPI0039BE6F63
MGHGIHNEVPAVVQSLFRPPDMQMQKSASGGHLQLSVGIVEFERQIICRESALVIDGETDDAICNTLFQHLIFNFQGKGRRDPCASG